MKKLLMMSALLAALAGCKKGEICDNGCYVVPPIIYFIIADSNGNSLVSSVNDGLGVAYVENKQLITLNGLNYPFAALAGATTDYLFADRAMASKSEEGIKVFYVTYRGKTDTLNLDIHRVSSTPDNGGNSDPVVSFNGRPMQRVLGGGSTPTYFVLKRR